MPHFSILTVLVPNHKRKKEKKRDTQNLWFFICRIFWVIARLRSWLPLSAAYTSGWYHKGKWVCCSFVLQIGTKPQKLPSKKKKISLKTEQSKIFFAMLIIIFLCLTGSTLLPTSSFCINKIWYNLYFKYPKILSFLQCF